MFEVLHKNRKEKFKLIQEWNTLLTSKGYPEDKNSPKLTTHGYEMYRNLVKNKFRKNMASEKMIKHWTSVLNLKLPKRCVESRKAGSQILDYPNELYENIERKNN
jgi:hypothetical protein